MAPHAESLTVPHVIFVFDAYVGLHYDKHTIATGGEHREVRPIHGVGRVRDGAVRLPC